MTQPAAVDVAVIGAGQSGLAAAYYLRRVGLEPHTGYVVLDANTTPGGAWQHLWSSLRLFSPAEYSSLPGWLMPTPAGAGFPPAEHVVDYLTRYEQRYRVPVHHGTRVLEVCRADADPRGRLVLRTTDGAWAARAVLSATGTWGRPFVPHYPGMGRFRGHQLHSAAYRGPQGFEGRRVIVVGAATPVPSCWPSSQRSPTPPGSPRDRPGSCRTTWTGASSSPLPRRDAGPSTRGWPTPEESPRWATS